MRKPATARPMLSRAMPLEFDLYSEKDVKSCDFSFFRELFFVLEPTFKKPAAL
jgi:hypothetical protein